MLFFYSQSKLWSLLEQNFLLDRYPSGYPNYTSEALNHSKAEAAAATTILVIRSSANNSTSITRKQQTGSSYVFYLKSCNKEQSEIFYKLTFIVTTASTDSQCYHGWPSLALSHHQQHYHYLLTLYCQECMDTRWDGDTQLWTVHGTLSERMQ